MRLEMQHEAEHVQNVKQCTYGHVAMFAPNLHVVHMKLLVIQIVYSTVSLCQPFIMRFATLHCLCVIWGLQQARSVCEVHLHSIFVHCVCDERVAGQQELVRMHKIGACASACARAMRETHAHTVELSELNCL